MTQNTHHPVLKALVSLRDEWALTGNAIRRQIISAQIAATERTALGTLYHLG